MARRSTRRADAVGGRSAPSGRFSSTSSGCRCARADPASPHDVRAGRDLLRDSLACLPRVRAIVADRGYRGLCNIGQPPQPAARHQDSAEGPGRLSRRSRRSTRSSTPSPSSAAGGDCRAATRAARRAPRPGSRWPRSAISWAGPSSEFAHEDLNVVLGAPCLTMKSPGRPQSSRGKVGSPDPQ